MTKQGLVLAAALVAGVLMGCSSGHECGDSVCSDGETHASCPDDCTCGDGLLDVGEECDGTRFGGATCASLGEGPGALTCTAECTIDTSSCGGGNCGNDKIDPGEDCDGTDLGDATCTSSGFGAGDIACGSNCKYDYTACCNNECPDSSATQCSGDTIQTCVDSGTGCMIWQDGTDCSATGEFCADDGSGAVCGCNDTCVVDSGRCNGDVVETCQEQANGCLDWSATESCGTTTGGTCVVTSTGPTCTSAAAAEDCDSAFELSTGVNAIAWSAINLDYLSSPDCGFSQTGPDIVLSYTATKDGALDFSMDKQEYSRHMLQVSDQACGTVTPALTCVSEYSYTSMGGSIQATAGTTYYFYITDSSSGSDPLPNPLSFTLTEFDCSTYAATATTLDPADGATTTTLSPTFDIDFDTAMNPDVGVVTITGDKGTSLSIDLSTSPSSIYWTNTDKHLQVDPGMSFPPGEHLTISWTGMEDARCGNAVAAPTWSVDVLTPPCTPGQGGLLSGIGTLIPSGIPTFTVYTTAADTAANGWVYAGGYSDLYRLPKAGGTAQNVATAANLNASKLGYAMAVSGNRVWTIDDGITQTERVWLITDDGGSSWNPQDYASFATTPGDDFRGASVYKGKLYLITHESSSTLDTEIWSVDANATTLPAAATLEGSFQGEYYCSGLAVDDNYFYTACWGADHVVRIDRSTFALTTVADSWLLDYSANGLQAYDNNGDGTADILYVNAGEKKVQYLCEPSATPYANLLLNFGGTTTNYGMGFDNVGNRLWLFDDDTSNFIRVQ